MFKRLMILMIRIYRNYISPFLGYRCRFFPTCSLYSQIAVERHGVFYGIWLTVKRLVKCHPWYSGEGYDPVPEVVMEKEKK